jgi:hypothetical protein
MTDMHDLFTQVATALAGRKVIVRLRHPAIKEFDGVALENHGQPIIDVNPGLSDDGMFKVLLHEAAHLRLGHVEKLEAVPNLPGVGKAMPSSEPGSVSLGKTGMFIYSNSPGNRKIEVEAEALAQSWLDYANEHAKDFSIHRSQAERMLMALATPAAKEFIEWRDKQIKIANDYAMRYEKGIKKCSTI